MFRLAAALKGQDAGRRLPTSLDEPPRALRFVSIDGWARQIPGSDVSWTTAARFNGGWQRNCEGGKRETLPEGSVSNGSQTATCFRREEPHYHRRGGVSRSCSGWEGVVPPRHGRLTNWGQTALPLGEQRSRKPQPALAKARLRNASNERAKSLERLVPVSCARRRASTSGLSTSWSKTTLRYSHMGSLIFGRASRLDAFSDYPDRT